MNKFISLVLIAALLMLASCGEAKKSESKNSGKGFDPNAWVVTPLQGSVTDSTTADFKDDFNLAANADIVKNLTIPEGKKVTGGMYDAGDENEKRLISLLTDDSLTGPEAEQVHALYGMIMDWDTRNKQGAESVKKYIVKIQSVKTLEEMTKLLCEKNMQSATGSLVGFSVAADKDDPGVYTTYLEPASLTLEDAGEYTKEMTDNGKLIKETAEKCWPVVLTAAGMSEKEADDITARSFEFEKKLSENIMTNEYRYANNEEKLIHNPASPEEVEKMAGSFPIKTLLDAYGVGDSKKYDVEEPKYIKSLSSIYTEENLEGLKAWLITGIAKNAMNLIDKDTRDKTDKITNELAGIKGVKSDDAAAMDIVNQELSLSFDNLYISKFCTEEMRSDIMDMINTSIENYREMLSEEDWLSKETRDKAVEKLDNMVLRAVYPDKIERWTDLKVKTFDDGSTLFDTVVAIRNYRSEQIVMRVNTKKDRSYWDRAMMPTNMTNAFYDPTDNSINIMAGILLGCMYGKDKSDEENLGAVGTVIGHEISHAFDPAGAQYDKVGKMESWWTEEDQAAFDERAKKLIAYYDRIEPIKGLKCNGSMLQGEATADMGGMKCVLRTAAKVKGFDYKKFFESNAHVWGVVMVESSIKERILQDVHPLSYLRVNATVQQMQEFYDTYDVKEGDGMYLSPEDRISIW